MEDCKSKDNTGEWYLVEIVETLARTVKVRAKSIEAAYAVVEDAYHNRNIVLGAEDTRENRFYTRKAGYERLESYEEVK